MASHCTGCELSIRSLVLSVPAPRIMGIDSKNENLAAASRVKPSISAAVIVIPEREVPGISESACANPIIIISRKLRLYSSLTCLPFTSDHHSRAPNPMVVAAIIKGLRRLSSRPLLITKPNAMAGMEAKIIHQAKRLFEVGWRVTREVVQSRLINQTS